jgi:hypothetical protein
MNWWRRVFPWLPPEAVAHIVGLSAEGLPFPRDLGEVAALVHRKELEDLLDSDIQEYGVPA